MIEHEPAHPAASIDCPTHEANVAEDDADGCSTDVTDIRAEAEDRPLRETP